jgi:hypothetical protein
MARPKWMGHSYIAAFLRNAFRCLILKPEIQEQDFQESPESFLLYRFLSP